MTPYVTLLTLIVMLISVGMASPTPVKPSPTPDMEERKVALIRELYGNE